MGKRHLAQPIGRVRTFPGDDREYPIFESGVGMLVMPNKNDVKMAERKSPTQCALACAVKRAAGAEHVWVAGTVAYVVVSYQGQLVAMKFRITPYTRDAIVRFDETGEMPSEGFEFGPITAGWSAEVRRVRNAARYQPGSRKRDARPRTANRPKRVTFRHLSGQVHTARS